MNNKIERTRTPSTAPEKYWNQAGEVGYTQAMYSNSLVADHVKNSIWTNVLNAAAVLGLDGKSEILELGCGDGDLANNCLSFKFASVEGHDLAPAGIERANLNRKPNTHFICSDITRISFPPNKKFDAVFFIGVLHHVKASTPSLVQSISHLTDKIVVMEPNGNHIVRKALERLPSYKAAGEDSFRKDELSGIFQSCGYREVYYRRFNFFPNFTPKSIFAMGKHLEPWIENSSLLGRMCTNQVFSFRK